MYPIHLKKAKVIRGRGRGRTIGIPTLNIDFSPFHDRLTHGIYACWVMIGTKKYMAAMHYGARPAFQDTETLEVHILDHLLTDEPQSVDITVVGRIRDIENFNDSESLVRRIQEDIERARGMLVGA